jgi:shikimate dehydrogenase
MFNPRQCSGNGLQRTARALVECVMPKSVYTLADLRDWPAVTAGEGAPARLSVFGDPVKHSRSPQMHDAALAAAGIAARYVRLHILPAELPEALRLLPEKGFVGTNVTIPHKAAAMALMDEVDPAARRGGGVNTVVVRGGKLVGYSTDGPGLVRAIREEFGVGLDSLRVMILGAGGGAGRAIAVQCAMEKCKRLVLVNRTHERAVALAGELMADLPVEAIPWDKEALGRQMSEIDLVINATPLGMIGGSESPIPASLLSPGQMVYDTVYAAERTPLLMAADKAGARGANGLSMLLHQGVLSVERGFGRPAPVEAMRVALGGSPLASE